MAHAGGRPTDYTPELAIKICDAIVSTPASLESICDENKDFPHKSNLFRWMHRFPEFRDQYLAAKETQGILLTEDMLEAALLCPEISESISKQTMVFRVLQWHLSKLAPKQFGDKSEVKSTGTVNVVLHEDRLKELE